MANPESIVYRLKQKLQELQSQVGKDVEIRTNSHSGEQGCFDYIRKFDLGENSYLGLRIKKDDIYASENEINFYALRYLTTKEERESARSRYSRFAYSIEEYEKPLFSSSINISYEKLKEILIKIQRYSSTKHQIIEILNEEKIFDFDLNVLLLSSSKFEKELKENLSDNDLIFKDVCQKLLLLSKQSFLEDLEIAKKIKLEVENLSQDEEYNNLLQERERLDQLLSEKTKQLDSIKKEQSDLKVKMNILNYFETEYKKYDSDEKISDRKKQQILNVVIQDMIYAKRFDLFDKELFPKLPQDTNQRLSFQTFNNN